MKKNSDDIDSVLIEKAKNGNEGAFSILVNKYHPRVYASLFSFTKSKEDSEDLSQQTFIKVWQQLSSFRGESAFFTWVYRIAINLAKNYVSSAAYKKQKISSSIEFLELDVTSFEDLESIIIHDQSLREINDFIITMPESLKTAFSMREVEGKSYAWVDTRIEGVLQRVKVELALAQVHVHEHPCRRDVVAAEH